ncbi:MAG: protein-L-isoaspartate O-methyltransferase [bacterium]|nr:protein-L-isoaspartate O-methyltransferase [bacterium]
MVDEQIRDAGVTDPAVLGAMRDVPRHRFVPRLLHHRAYQGCALPIGHGQTISQPFIVGLMTALLELKGDERVLEVGTGSGYQAAILSRLAREVVSVERIESLALRAAKILEELSCANVVVRAADGASGSLEAGPLRRRRGDRPAPRLPSLLFHELRDGGVLVLPIGGDDEQILYRYRKVGEPVVELLRWLAGSCRCWTGAGARRGLKPEAVLAFPGLMVHLGRLFRGSPGRRRGRSRTTELVGA